MTKRPSKIVPRNPLAPVFPARDYVPDVLIAAVVALALFGASLAVAGVLL